MQERRLLSVWRVAVIIAVILVVAALLGAKPLRLRADALDPSQFRTAALAVTGPLATASDFLRLDEPWEWATGYSDEAEAAGGEVVTVTTSPATTTSVTTTATTTSVTPAATTTTVGAGSGGSTTSSSPVTSSTTTTTTLPLFTAAQPLRMLVVGDSLMTLLGYSLVRYSESLPALEVKVVTKTSSGLARPDFYDWPQTLAELVADFHPHVTVMLFGGNEKQNMRHQRKSLEPFSEAWVAEYSRRVGGAIDITTNAGGRVIWMGLPIMRSAKFSETVRTLNGIYSAVCAQHPGATYIDGYNLFADEQGQYSAYLVDSSGRRKLMRADDGIHMTNAGGDRATEAVMEVLLSPVRFEP